MSRKAVNTRRYRRIESMLVTNRDGIEVIVTGWYFVDPTDRLSPRMYTLRQLVKGVMRQPNKWPPHALFYYGPRSELAR
jgi:hypothetical protein